jgi:hypothetical protein
VFPLSPLTYYEQGRQSDRLSQIAYTNLSVNYERCELFFFLLLAVFGLLFRFTSEPNSQPAALSAYCLLRLQYEHRSTSTRLNGVTSQKIRCTPL